MEPAWVWGAIGTVLAIETAVVGVVVWLVTQLNAASNAAIAAKVVADNTSIALMAEKLERERLAESLNNFKVEVAKEYVSHGTLTNFEKRVVGAVEHLTERFDAFLKGRA